MLLLLARLGLRAGDIVQRRLTDIDWEAGWIVVSGKSRRRTQLPLTQELGDALGAYLQEGRPSHRGHGGIRARTRAFSRLGIFQRRRAYRRSRRAARSC